MLYTPITSPAQAENAGVSTVITVSTDKKTLSTRFLLYINFIEPSFPFAATAAPLALPA